MSTADPDERPPTPYWIAFAAVAIGFAGGMFGLIMTQLVGSAFGSPVAHPTPAVNIIGDFVFDAAFVGAALYFTRIGGWMGCRQFGYRHVSWRRGIAAVVAAGVAYYAVTLAYAAVFQIRGTDRLPSSLGVQRSTWAAVFTALFVCVAAPMAEEFFFRGFLFGVLRRMRIPIAGVDLGPWLAATVVGLLFGLAHTGSAQSQFLIPLGFLGFLLCIVRWRTASLYPCMALHSINNAVAFGANEQLGWGAGAVIALIVGSLALIALVTGPLSVTRSRPVAQA